MNRAVLLMMLLSMARPVQAAESGAVVSAPAPAAPTQEVVAPQPAPQKKSVAKAKARTVRSGATTAAFRADLEACKALAAEERRDCERETQAARAEGLYGS